MPIYEFQCQSCGAEVEVIQKISDLPLTDCEACGKPELKKMVSAAAFRLSGSGWYETDFKTGKKKNLHGDSNSNTTKTSDKADSKESGKSKPESQKSSTKKTDSAA